MEVLEIKEQKDGSATINLDLSDEEVKVLLQYAIVNILKEQIESYEPIPA